MNPIPALLFGAALGSSPGTAALHGTTLHPWDEDRGYIEALEKSGDAVQGPHAVLFFPSATTTAEQRAALLTRCERGIAAAKELVGRPDWRFRGDPRIYFYYPDARFVAHAPGGNSALIPLWRALEDRSPWLHEIMHLLIGTEVGDWLGQPEEVQNARMPLWLHEGLADSLATDVAARTGLVNYSPLFEAADSPEIDALARTQLALPETERVLQYVGARGKLPELFTADRMKVVRPFYVLSGSFVRFLVARHGYPPLLHAIAAFDHENETLARAIGIPLADEKARWLVQLRAPTPPAE